MEPIIFLIWLAAGWSGVCVLAKLARDARDYRDSIKQVPPDPSPQPLSGKIIIPIQPPYSCIPETATAGYWWTRLLSTKGILGVFFLPVNLAFLFINSELLAGTIETILNRAPDVLFTISILGWDREVSNYDLYGALISLAEMAAAAIIHLTWEERRPEQRLLFHLGLSALLALVAYEVGASIYRAMKIDGDLGNAALSGTLAFAFATAAAATGIPLLGGFLIPLVLAILWTLAAPFRWIAHWRDSRPQTLRYKHREGKRQWGRKVAMVVLYPLAVLDYSLMAPLHRLDDVVKGALSSLTHRLSQGGQRHVELPVSNRPESIHVSNNGHDPARVRMDQPHTSQAPDRVDHRD